MIVNYIHNKTCHEIKACFCIDWRVSYEKREQQLDRKNMPVRAEMYFSFKSCYVVHMLNALQSQLFNFWTSQKV